MLTAPAMFTLLMVFFEITDNGSLGVTYTFNHASVHPLRFSCSDDGTHNGGSAYTTGVTTSNGVTTIEVTLSA